MEIELDTQFGKWLVIASQHDRFEVGSEVNVQIDEATTTLLAA